MKNQRLSGRQLKASVLILLQQEHLSDALEDIGRFPHRQVVNPLFSFFYYQDSLIRWRAIVAMGSVVASLAESDVESARVVMRRLMWNLNDESGGIGWGSPEAMGEILARSAVLADEFSHILVSYIREDMNFLEHEGLQRGVLWGLARLACARPALVDHVGPYLIPFLHTSDPILRGLAAKIAAVIEDDAIVNIVSPLTEDETPVEIYCNDRMVHSSVGALASSRR